MDFALDFSSCLEGSNFHYYYSSEDPLLQIKTESPGSSTADWCREYFMDDTQWDHTEAKQYMEEKWVLHTTFGEAKITKEGSQYHLQVQICNDAGDFLGSLYREFENLKDAKRLAKRVLAQFERWFNE